jgi:hypothetical protein
MPLPSHEVFAFRVCKAIEIKLVKFEETLEVRSIPPFVEDLLSGGSSNIKFDDGPNEEAYIHMPDGQFCFGKLDSPVS